MSDSLSLKLRFIVMETVDSTFVYPKVANLCLKKSATIVLMVTLLTIIRLNFAVINTGTERTSVSVREKCYNSS